MKKLNKKFKANKITVESMAAACNCGACTLCMPEYMMGAIGNSTAIGIH